LPGRRTAIAFAEPLRFLIDGERPPGLGGQHHLLGLRVELVVRGDLIVALDAFRQAIDGLQQRIAAFDLLGTEPVGGEILDLVIGLVGVAGLNDSNRPPR